MFCKKRPATLLKKRLWHRRFTVNFAKFLRTPFLQNTSGRLFGRRVSLIPQIQIGDKFITNFIENAKSFNDHFAKCRVIDNNSLIFAQMKD